MFRNYLKTAWRNVLKNRITTLINVSGLSVGIASAILIVIFIRNELSYDKFHKDASRLYQVIFNGKNISEEEEWGGNVAPPVGAALFNNVPEIESYTRLYKPKDIVLRYSNSGIDKFFTEKNVLAVDSNFLQVFDFKILEGSAATALIKPGSIVITQGMVKKYFGNEEAVGKTLLLGQSKKPFLVTAVLKDIPAQSSIQFDFLTPMTDFPIVKQFNWSWVWRQVICYVKLKSNVGSDAATIRTVESKFPAVVRVQAAEGFKKLGKSFDDFIKNGGKWDYHLMPLTDVHLHSAGIFMPWLYHISNIKYIYIFASIALFIILLACVNFINLSTARAANRAKEIGIRKVTGSTRGQLIKQFLSEAFLYSFISSLLAVVLVLLALKTFSVIIDETLNFSTVFTADIWLSLLGLTILVGFVAGSYPAFYITSFKPVAALKGKNFLATGRKGLLVRNSLVVFQFTISTIIIVGTVVVYKQLNFFRNTDLGFNKENVVTVTSTNRLGKSEESFRQAIAQVQGVTNASIATSIPSGFLFADSYQPQPETPATTKELDLASFIVDEKFVPTLGIKVLQGRNFSKDFSDSASVILNEEAVKQIGWKDPIGKTLKYPGGNDVAFNVIGIVKNFNVESLHTAITPFALFYSTSKTYDVGVSNILVKIKSDNIGHTLSQLESTWKNFAPSEPFDYNFLDAAFDAQYRSEQRLGSIFITFALLSIFIACFGLFGLCAYVAERRTKEIGIRKVLGASVQGIAAMISIDFLKLILIAAVIAFPVSWWAMNKWLQDFAYRIQIDWTIFVIAGFSTLIISLFTISYQSIKAGLSNPVQSLKAE